MSVFTTRMRLVTRQLDRAPFMTGAAFTAPDISVGYALEMAQKNISFVFGEVERRYMARLRERADFQRARQVYKSTRDWWTR